MELAREHHAAGSFEEAVRICREGLAKHPAYHSARVLLAKSLLGLGRHEEAAGELELVGRQAPDNVMARRLLAEAYAGAGRHEDARDTLEELLRLHPEDVETVERLEQLREQVPTGERPQAAPSGAVGVSTVKVPPDEAEPERAAAPEEAPAVDLSEEVTKPPSDRAPTAVEPARGADEEDTAPPTDPYLHADPSAWTSPGELESEDRPTVAMAGPDLDAPAGEMGEVEEGPAQSTVVMSPSELEGLGASAEEPPAEPAGEEEPSTVMMAPPRLEAPPWGSEEPGEEGNEPATVMMSPSDLAEQAGLRLEPPVPPGEAEASTVVMVSPDLAAEAPPIDPGRAPDAAGDEEDAVRTDVLEPDEVAAMSALPDEAPAAEIEAAAPEATAEPARAEEAPDEARTVTMFTDGAEPEPEDEDPLTTALPTPTLAELYRSQGMPEKALEIYEQVLAGDSGNEEIQERVRLLRQALAPPEESLDRKKIRVLRRWLGAIRRAGNAQDRA